MKTCTSCGETKDDREFPNRARQTNKCRACHNSVQYRYDQANPENKRRTRNDRIKRNRERLREYKEQHSCTDCGGSFPAFVMDFHHPGKEKHKSVSRLAGSASSWNKVLEEIQRCVLLCSNCHRIRHKGVPNQWQKHRDG